MTKKNTKKELIVNDLNFTIDAGLIDILGRQLVAKAETAVAEIVKNAYDADATAVTVKFIDARSKGGTLEIFDNGSGMTYDELVNGFMRISSDLKKDEPTSKKYKRTKAGKKGIGRFATQRLGSKLTIKTKSLNDDFSYVLRVSWDNYKSGVELGNVKNKLEVIEDDFNIGTTIRIENLREPWTKAQIKRVYRYLMEVVQPEYLSKQAKNLNRHENTFEVTCFEQLKEDVEELASTKTSIYKNSLARIEGEIENGKGYVSINSNRYNINDEKEKIQKNDIGLPNIKFKTYYNINNFDYYKGFISKADYNLIRQYNLEQRGVRLYRNGFRVLPYGSKENDWLSLEKSSFKADDNAYVPFGNRNFTGFVEIIDKDDTFFEETSSREGLIENYAFELLTEFLNDALAYGAKRVNSARLREKNNPENNNDTDGQSTANDNVNTSSEDNNTDNNNSEDNYTDTENIEETKLHLDIELLQILATIGLSTGEFIHEIRQFVPAFNGGLKHLSSKKLDVESQKTIELLNSNFNRFRSYTAYIDSTLTKANDEKDLIPLDILVKDFNTLMKDDLELNQIKFDIELIGYDLLTKPMYAAEWDSILYNLYSNSKKAIFRAEKEERKIKVVVGKSEDIVYLEFLDNGDGIPVKNHDRIFDAFFTTATKSESFTTTQFEFNGTGLGLKITKDIIFAYNGKILVAEAENQFSTNIRIELPAASENEINEYYG